MLAPADLSVSVRGRLADVHPGGGDGVSFRLDHIASPSIAAGLDRLAAPARERTDLLARAAADPEPVVPVAFAVTEDQPRNAPLHQRGDPEKPGDEVPRRWLSILGGDPVPPDSGSGRRELADWIAASPLSSRVIVNRL